MTDFFAETRPGLEARHASASFELPILYFRDDMFAVFHTADLRRVRGLMPSDKLHPVALPGGRAMVGIAAFNYIDTTIGPYGEVGAVVPCVLGRRPVPGLPGVMEARYPGFGNLVLHLPVTKAVARDAGRGEWGYTKFIADMHFRSTPELYSCRLSEGGQHILTIEVAKRGMVTRDAKPLITYSVLDRALIRTVVPQRGIARNAIKPKGCRLELGDHQVARSLEELDLSPRALMSRYYLQRSGILPSGVAVEEGVRPLDGFCGGDREGEHTVEYL